MTYPGQQPPLSGTSAGIGEPPPRYLTKSPPPPARRSGKLPLAFGFLAGTVLGLAGGIVGTLVVVDRDVPAPSQPEVVRPLLDPDPFSAQAGDCLHAVGDSNGEFSRSAERVACSDPEANYVVIEQLFSTTGLAGKDCSNVPGWVDGNSVVYDFDSNLQGLRQICVMPKSG